MDKKKVVILDLDDTLIDTSKIRRQIVKLAHDLGVPSKAALSARGRVRSSSKPFTIENYGRFLFPSNVVKQKILATNFKKMFAKRGAFNYPGVEDFLKLLAKKYNLVLLTYGNATLQKTKIVQSGLSKYFSKVIITPDNTKMQPIKTLIKKHGTKNLFIDNAKAACDAACKLGLPMIWVTSKSKDSAYFRRLEERIAKLISNV